jgi:phosphoribosylformylglycinamidine synthase
MRSNWRDEAGEHTVTSPMTVIISAFAPVTDVRGVRTPWLRTDRGATVLVHVDLGDGACRLGGSALAQVRSEVGDRAPDVRAPRLRSFFEVVQRLHAREAILAYHDVSDGGLLVCLLEMAFASRCGLRIALPAGAADDLALLFAEELGAVLQVSAADADAVLTDFAAAGVRASIIGTPATDERIEVRRDGRLLLDAGRAPLQRRWAEVSFRMQQLRDDPGCAQEEFDAIDDDAAVLAAKVTFPLPHLVPGAPAILSGARPRVAVLREQGVNGHAEMAAAFAIAGFDAVDVHMTDLLDRGLGLEGFQALVACGGFSYGDVLGAGAGWARSILFHPRTRDAFAAFFARPDTLSLGICNGCQMFAHLRELVPGAAHWPTFLRNRSQQFEARQVLVQVDASPSPWLAGMAGSVLPVVVAHGEGRAGEVAAAQRERLQALAPLRYVDGHHRVTARYPANPNGSPEGIAGLTNEDGRVLIMMPHPERVVRTVANSWHPADWPEHGPWLSLFANARKVLS